jgi:hypothetical protein
MTALWKSGFRRTALRIRVAVVEVFLSVWDSSSLLFFLVRVPNRFERDFFVLDDADPFDPMLAVSALAATAAAATLAESLRCGSAVDDDAVDVPDADRSLLLLNLPKRPGLLSDLAGC